MCKETDSPVMKGERSTVPSSKAWITVKTDALHLDRIMNYDIMNDRLEAFEQIWRPLSAFWDLWVTER